MREIQIQNLIRLCKIEIYKFIKGAPTTYIHVTKIKTSTMFAHIEMVVSLGTFLGLYIEYLVYIYGFGFKVKKNKILK